MKNLSIIIACYNEQDNIEETVLRVRKTVPEAEIVVVDDGSKDKTVDVVKNMKLKNLKLVSYQPNMGKGYAIKQGIINGKEEIQAQVDADSQFPPEELPGLIKPILDKKSDIVFCSRFIKGATVEKGSLTRMRRVANFVVSSFTSLLCGQWLTDVNAGFKAWTKKAMMDIDMRCPHFGYEPEIAIMARKKGYKIVEFPINYKRRLEGNTNVNLWREGVIIPLFLLKTKFFR
ncbi:glycosyltransferase family 2 protein [Candidatus Woesearchaeota archaeon]|nr:glycosyltransferase family 2 protein [Candidatus Woesearchaeota archaeon]